MQAAIAAKEQAMIKRIRLTMFLVISTLLMTLPLASLSAQQVLCPLGISYWSNTPAAWTVNSLMLGSQFYTQAELIPLMLGTNPNDASTQLAAQLAAAKLNIAAGNDPTPVASTILTADTLLTSYTGRLPYNVDPASTAGQAMLTTAAALNAFNLGQQTQGCTPVPTGTLTVQPTLTPTGTITPTPTPGTGPVTIIIEGPVQAININIITIYDFEIIVDPADPILTIIRVGDIIRVVGDIDDFDDDEDTTIVIIAITVIVVDVDIVIDDGGEFVWRDEGDCSNPPPPWATANGWRRRCEGGGNPGNGNGNGRGRGNDDDD
jgi:hypothetical protein